VGSRLFFNKRKVRTPKGKMPANSWALKIVYSIDNDGKCHRKYTAILMVRVKMWG